MKYLKALLDHVTPIFFILTIALAYASGTFDTFSGHVFIVILLSLIICTVLCIILLQALNQSGVQSAFFSISSLVLVTGIMFCIPRIGTTRQLFFELDMYEWSSIIFSIMYLGILTVQVRWVDQIKYLSPHWPFLLLSVVIALVLVQFLVDILGQQIANSVTLAAIFLAIAYFLYQISIATKGMESRTAFDAAKISEGHFDEQLTELQTLLRSDLRNRSIKIYHPTTFVPSYWFDPSFVRFEKIREFFVDCIEKGHNVYYIGPSKILFRFLLFSAIIDKLGPYFEPEITPSEKNANDILTMWSMCCLRSEPESIRVTDEKVLLWFEQTIKSRQPITSSDIQKTVGDILFGCARANYYKRLDLMERTLQSGPGQCQFHIITEFDDLITEQLGVSCDSINFENVFSTVVNAKSKVNVIEQHLFPQVAFALAEAEPDDPDAAEKDVVLFRALKHGQRFDDMSEVSRTSNKFLLPSFHVLMRFVPRNEALMDLRSVCVEEANFSPQTLCHDLQQLI